MGGVPAMVMDGGGWSAPTMVTVSNHRPCAVHCAIHGTGHAACAVAGHNQADGGGCEVWFVTADLAPVGAALHAQADRVARHGTRPPVDRWPLGPVMRARVTDGAVDHHARDDCHVRTPRARLPLRAPSCLLWYRQDRPG